MPYLIYLRKSRSDLEAEQQGQGETLSRHRDALLNLAKRLKLDIGGIYEEVVSGETIAARPKMQRLLSEVEEGAWTGVLVMEVERLARGDSIDQGIVAQAFKYSGTKIITPAKTYDPANEFDEEYFEFGLFMSRREYKTIKRRMTAGRIASVKEGKYMGKTDPYGYRRVKLEHGKGYTLETVPEQAAVVNDIFEMRLSGTGCYAIARKLNEMGTRTNAGIKWSGQSVINILRNPLYAGYVTWGRRPGMPSVKNGRISKPRRFTENYVKTKGLHPAIISTEAFDKAQELLKNAPAFPVKKNLEPTNPFVGLLHCAKCGHVMIQFVSRGKPRICCRWPACDNVSSAREDIEKALTLSLRLWISNYKVDPLSQNTLNEKLEKQIRKKEEHNASVRQEIKKLGMQLERASELVEQNVYTTEYFMKRKKQITEQQDILSSLLNENETTLEALRNELVKPVPESSKNYSVLDAYNSAETMLEKNELLKTMLLRIDYLKTAPKSRKHDSRIILKLLRRFEQA